MDAATQHKKKLLGRVVRSYVLPYRGRLLVAMGCMIIMAAATAANAYMMQPVMDDIFLNKNRELLLIIPFVLFGIAVINALADYGQSYSLRYTGQHVVADMQADLFAHLIAADITLHQQESSGNLIARLTHDIMLMRNAVSTVLTGFVKESLSMVFLVGVMFYQGWEMALGAFGILIFAVLPILKLGRRMRKVAGATQSRLSGFTGQLDDILRSVKVVKAYNREAHEAKRVRQSVAELCTLYVKAARIQVLSGPLMAILTGAAIAGIIGYGGAQVMDGTLSAGAFFSFITAMLMAYRPVKVLAGLNTQLQEGMAAAERFYAVMDKQPDIISNPQAPALPRTADGIRFCDVHFTYPHSDAGIHGVSFDVPPGKTVALVGSSGGGKSTIMQLILRFYDVDAGHIEIGGHALPEVELRSLRNQCALVSQEVLLFDDTVRANIGYGNLDADDNAIIDAAKRANAHAFIAALPQGYDTPIGAGGNRLSGGQRQRIAIARALLKEAPILLLDEATSALDTESERHVQQALDTLMGTRTTLVIAHRLSTVQHADTIVVIEGGHAVEVGTHSELLARNGRYAALYAQQFSSVEPAA
jgi:subfamily B ATP-binding cassette protein MsbA